MLQRILDTTEVLEQSIGNFLFRVWSVSPTNLYILKEDQEEYFSILNFLFYDSRHLTNKTVSGSKISILEYKNFKWARLHNGNDVIYILMGSQLTDWKNELDSKRTFIYG